MPEIHSDDASAAESIYLGIDIAGDSGESGVVEIVKTAKGLVYRLPAGPWTGKTGLERMAKLTMKATQSAVDQPFGYAEATMNLLLDHTDGQGGLQGVDYYSSRQTDRAMREILREYGLSGDYVMSPNRCQNVWRALALAKFAGFSRKEVCAGLGRVVETHPRVAWAVILFRMFKIERLRELIAGYKTTKKCAEDIAVAASCRQEMLVQFEIASGICPDGGDSESKEQLRAEIVGSADNFEAIAAAFVAYLCKKGKSVRALPAPAPSIETIALEGVAVLPVKDWSPL